MLASANVKVRPLVLLAAFFLQGMAQEEVDASLEQEGSSDATATSEEADDTQAASQSRRFYGRYKIHLGAARPTFTDLDNYDKFYGASRFMPTFGVDYYMLDWFAAMGLGFRLGYYKDDGRAANVSGNDVTGDEESPAELTLIPVQMVLNIQATPFRAKWVTIGGWFGGEAMYFQEVRVDDASTSSDSSDSNTEDSPFINTGWKYGTTIGAWLSFLLNPLDEKSVKSMNTMGVGNAYITPYIEVVASLDSSKASFARNTYGLAFSFESY